VGVLVGGLVFGTLIIGGLVFGTLIIGGLLTGIALSGRSSHTGVGAVPTTPAPGATSAAPTTPGTATPGSASAAPVSEQDLYVATLLKDYRSLDRGVLTYSPIGSLQTGASVEFSVKVLDVGKGPQQGRVRDFNGMSVYQQDVPTGGMVGVQIVGSQNVTWTGESSVQQPVLRQGQDAIWYWSITAGSPGPAEITLRADTYDRGSGQELSEEITTSLPPWWQRQPLSITKAMTRSRAPRRA
jgi:hypothetical protein